MFSRFTKFGKDWMGFTGGLGGKSVLPRILNFSIIFQNLKHESSFLTSEIVV